MPLEPLPCTHFISLTRSLAPSRTHPIAHFSMLARLGSSATVQLRAVAAAAAAVTTSPSPRRRSSACFSVSAAPQQEGHDGSAATIPPSVQGVRITDKRTAAARAAAASAASAAASTTGSQQEAQSSNSSSSSKAAPAATSEPLSNEELLKKRMRMAQQRLENPAYTASAAEAAASASSPASADDAAAPFFPASTSALAAGAGSLLNSASWLQPAVEEQPSVASTAASSQSAGGHVRAASPSHAKAADDAGERFQGSDSGNGGGGEGVLFEQDGTVSTTMTSPSTGALQANASSSYSRPARITHPFDTHAFVGRLLQGGFRNRTTVKAGTADAQQTQLQLGNNPHDPAEALMHATRHLLITRSEAVLERNLNKTQVENEAYLFSAALSELRTELQVRARSDAAALRSITTLLQREVDGLSQRMNEEINTLKHDIAVDMNNRKGESQQDTNSLEQEIQDLQNRFTLSLGDLRVEIEESIRWGATRRALGLFFGIAIIVSISLWTADYMTRGYDPKAAAEAAAKAASEEALNLRPKTSEELGLEEKYNDLAEVETGGRHV